VRVIADISDIDVPDLSLVDVVFTATTEITRPAKGGIVKVLAK